MKTGAVLHVTSLLGGGVDRHVRDIARNTARRHVVWHTGDGGDVIELPAERRFVPLDRGALERDGAPLAEWLRAREIGVVHAHSVSRATRRRARWAAAALAANTIVTLHDVLFLREDALEHGEAGPDPAWLGETGAYLREAGAVVAPSRYIADLARTNLPGVVVDVVPNGSPPPRARVQREPRADFAARRPRHVVAMLGAIGPHKGSAVVEELSRTLAGTGIAIVVIGYLDVQVVPGWRGEGVFVHGAYEDDEVPGLLAAYGAELALFPNRAPESFSYALSDLWDAGLPAIVPPEGALAERVLAHGGGWLLPKGFGAAEVRALLDRLFSPEGAADIARVKSQLAPPDATRVPRLDDMYRSLDALYARFAVEPRAPVDANSAAVQRLIATSLDGSLFRVELARLADEYAQLEAALGEERSRAAQFADEARGWIAKLEADVAALKADLAAEVDARRALGQENVQLGIHKAAFDLLPEFMRKMLLKKILDARS